MGTRFTLKEAWASYEAEVLPADAPKIQREECRLAFHAGAAALFGGVMGALDPGQEATDADIDFMTRLQAELLDSSSAVYESRAQRGRLRPRAARPPAEEPLVRTGGHDQDEAPKAREMREQLQRLTVGLAAMLKKQLEGAQCGFALVLFDFGEKGSMAYAADGVRGDMIKLFRETADKIEAAGEAKKFNAALRQPRN
jgi:hypothetical protein